MNANVTIKHCYHNRERTVLFSMVIKFRYLRRVGWDVGCVLIQGLIIVALFACAGYSQISGPGTVIAGQPATWTSDMSASTSYTWNTGSISNQPVPPGLIAREVATGAIGVPDYPSVWYDPSNGHWYAFFLSGGITVAAFGPADLWRVDLGTDPSSGTPPGGGNPTNLGNFGLHAGATGNTDCAHAIIYDSTRGEWSCFIMRTGTPVVMHRIDFGTTLANNPTTSTAVNIAAGMGGQVAGSKMMYDRGRYILFVGSRWGQPVRVNFGPDVHNVNPACDMMPNIVTHGVGIGTHAARSSALEIAYQNGNWYMFTSTTDVAGNGGNKLWRHDFGPDLMSAPSRLTGLGMAGLGSHYWAVRIIPGLCGKEFYGYAQHSQGYIQRMDFNGDLESVPVVTGNVGTRGSNGWPVVGPNTPWDPSGFHTFVYKDSLYALTSGHSWKKLYITNLNYNFGSAPVHKYPSDNTYTHTFTTPGTYDISLTVNLDGYGSAQVCRTIKVVNEPVYSVAPASVCAPDTIVYEVDTMQGITLWEWDYTGAGVLYSTVTTDARNELIFTAAATDGTLRVRATGGFGTSAYADTLIRVRRTPSVTLSPAGAHDICDGDSLRLTADADIPVQYQWQLNGGVQPGDAAHHDAMATGDYTVIVTTPDGYCPAISDPVHILVHPQPLADLGKDTNICESALPLRLHSLTPVPPGTHYVWSNGLSVPETDIVRDGIHWLEVSLGSCTHRDSILVRAIPDPYVFIGADTIICEQFPVRIGTEIAGAAHLWNTGASGAYISAHATGRYILSVDMDGCVVRDTIDITALPVPVIDLGGDRDICPEQTIVLDGRYGGNSNYGWNTGSTDALFTATAAGVYGVVVVTEHGCVGGDTVTLHYYPKPTVSLGPDTTVCGETSLVLSPWRINTDSLIWSDGSVSQSYTVAYGGEYRVTAVNKCGIVHDTIRVKDIYCDIWIPEAFTPNNDGLNDIFRALGNLARIEGFRLSVYNRWGERVFYTEDKTRGWDGTQKGAPPLSGTYLYLLEYTWGGNPYEQKGTFHLIL